MLSQKKIFEEKDGTIGYFEAIFNSSNVLKSTYFPKNNKLYISFSRGGTYSYDNIDQTLYDEFETAVSQGIYFNENIKNTPEKYPPHKEFTLYPSEVSDLKEVVEKTNKINEDQEIKLIDEDQYINLIAFLQKTLEFYSNENNYNKNKDSKSLIEVDKGTQANFAIKQAEDLIKSTADAEIEYDKIIEDAEKNINTSPRDILKDLEGLKGG
jgi:KTSC domain